jgi:predicted dehydrogenase
MNCTIEGDGGEDTRSAIISLKYPSVKEYVFIQADYYSDPEQRHFFIEGSKGNVYVDLVKRNVFCSSKATGKKWQELAANDSFDQNYIDEMKSFIAAIQKGWHPYPLATGEDGIAALYQVIDAREKAGLK